MNSKYLKIFILLILLALLYYGFNLKQASQDDLLILEEFPLNHTSEKSEYCSYYKCLDVYFVHKHGFSIHFTPHLKFRTKNHTSDDKSEQFIHLKKSITNNVRYSKTRNSSFVIPDIDLLVAPKHFPSIINSLHLNENWNTNHNFLIFNFIANENHLKFIRNSGFKMIFASSSSYYPYYRSEVDVSIPFFNPYIQYSRDEQKKIYLYIMQKSALKNFPDIVKNFFNITENHKLVVRIECSGSLTNSNKICARIFHDKFEGFVEKPYHYYERHSVFCVIFNIGNSMGLNLFNALSKNCIPVIFSDQYVLPFSEVIDWTRCVISLRHYQMSQLTNIVISMSPDTILSHQRHCWFLFSKYMSSMNKIVETTLQIVESRFFPMQARSYFWWNEPDYEAIESLSDNGVEEQISVKINAQSFGRDIGFTAIVFVHYHCDRQADQLMLDFSVEYLAKSTHLAHAVFVTDDRCVIRTNQLTQIKVTTIALSSQETRMPIKYSYLSNIDTDAVLVLHWGKSTSLLTTKDIENGFKMWLSNMHQLVGLRYQQCLRNDNSVSRYPIDAVFMNSTTLRNHSDRFFSLLNHPSNNSLPCCNQDLLMSPIWPSIYHSAAKSCL